MADSLYSKPYQPPLVPTVEAWEKFAGVLGIIDVWALARFASNVRIHGHHSVTKADIHATNDPKEMIPCVVLSRTMNGTYNIALELEFNDGVRWILKVPMDGHGDNFKPLNQEGLIAEARTMRMLKTETNIPVPTVYAFDTSTDNELGVSFILMENMSGKSAYHAWCDQGLPKGKLEQHRARMMQSVAAAMVQLNNFTYDQGGSLMFDDNGEVTGIGEIKQADGIGIWDGIPENCPYKDKHVWTAKGPLTDPKSFYLFTLNRLVNGTPADASPLTKGTIKALRLFIDWASERTDITGKRFVLAHPDLDLQNILVADDGTVTGFIDWDAAAAVPREMGCALYPNWLMRDWVASSYGDEVDVVEMETYRAMYAQFMEIEIERKVGGPGGLTELGTDPRQEADITRRSALMKNLDFACNFPQCTVEIVHGILNLGEEYTANEWDEVDDAGDTKCESNDGAEEDDAEVELAGDDELDLLEMYGDPIEAPGLSDPSAKSNEHPNDLGTSVSESKESTALRGPENTESGFKDPPITPSNDDDAEQAPVKSYKAGTLQLFYDFGARLTRLSAKALHRKNQKNQKVDLPKNLNHEAIKALLRLLQDKIQQMVDGLHIKEPETAEVQYDGISAPGQIDNIPHNEVENLDVPGEVATEPSEDRPLLNSSDSKSQVVTPIEARKPTSREEINEISARRQQLLMEAKEKKRAAKRAEKAAHEKEVREVWEDVARDVEHQGIPIEKIRDNKSMTVNCIRQALEAQEEAAFGQSSGVANAIPLTVNEIENQLPNTSNTPEGTSGSAGSYEAPVTVTKNENRPPNTFKVPEESSSGSNLDAGSSVSPKTDIEESRVHTPASTISPPSRKRSFNENRLAAEAQQLELLVSGNSKGPEGPASTDTTRIVDLEAGSRKLENMIGVKATVPEAPAAEDNASNLDIDVANRKLHDALLSIQGKKSRDECSLGDAPKLCKSDTDGPHTSQNRAAILKAPKQPTNSFLPKALSEEMVNTEAASTEKPKFERRSQMWKNLFRIKDDGSSDLESVKNALRLANSERSDSKMPQNRAAILGAPGHDASRVVPEASMVEPARMESSSNDQRLHDASQKLKALIGIGDREIDIGEYQDFGTVVSGLNISEPGNEGDRAAILEVEKQRAMPADSTPLTGFQKSQVGNSTSTTHIQTSHKGRLTEHQKHKLTAAKLRSLKAEVTAVTEAAPPAYNSQGKFIPRNKPCPCGSRRIFKWCCGGKQKGMSVSRSNHAKSTSDSDVDGKTKAASELETKYLGGYECHRQGMNERHPTTQNRKADHDVKALDITNPEFSIPWAKEDSPHFQREVSEHEDNGSAESTANISSPSGIPKTAQATSKEKWETFWSAHNKTNPQNVFTASEKGECKDSALYTPQATTVTTPNTPPQSSELDTARHYPEKGEVSYAQQHPPPANSSNSSTAPYPPPALYDYPNTTTTAAPNDTFTDDGTYTTLNILNILGRDEMELDELRMLRLKQGFLMVMEGL